MKDYNQTIRFIHISDLHLGFKFSNASFSLSKGDERRRDLIETLYRVIDYIAAQSIDFLFISGDAFESKYIKSAELADLNYNFKRIADCQVVIISGNHDPLSDRHIYDDVDWAENVHILRREYQRLEFSALKCTVTGSVFENEIKPPLDFAALPPTKSDCHNILLLHGNVFNDDGYCYIDRQKLLALDYDYIGLGHIHKGQFIAPHIAYAGSLEPLDFGEVGPHGFVLGCIGKTTEFKFVPFCKRQFVKLEIELTPQDVMTSLIEKIASRCADLSDHFVRIKLVGYRSLDLQIDYQRLQQALNLYYFELVDESKLDLDIAQIVADNEAGFIAQYAANFSADELTDARYQSAYQLGITMLYEEQSGHEDQ